MACFRVDFVGRGELAERQQLLGAFLNKLTRISEEFNICVLMVRLVPSLRFRISVTDLVLTHLSAAPFSQI